MASAGISMLITSNPYYAPPMCPLDLSSLKWGDDGELSPNDTLNLVERLARAEERSQGSDQSGLNSSSIPQEEPAQES